METNFIMTKYKWQAESVFNKPAFRCSLTQVCIVFYYQVVMSGLWLCNETDERLNVATKILQIHVSRTSYKTFQQISAFTPFTWLSSANSKRRGAKQSSLVRRTKHRHRQLQLYRQLWQGNTHTHTFPSSPRCCWKRSHG